LVSDGERLLEVHNNQAMLGLITGTGCMVTSIIGAFVGALHAKESFHVLAHNARERRHMTTETTAAALSYFCYAAERAGARTIAEGRGPGSFRTALLDELFFITPDDLEQHARIVEIPLLG
jgi:hydroxyethylthiazole kinase